MLSITLILYTLAVGAIPLIFFFMCVSIGWHAIRNLEVGIGNGRRWTGKSTLFLGIPLLLTGVVLIVGWLLVILHR